MTKAIIRTTIGISIALLLSSVESLGRDRDGNVIIVSIGDSFAAGDGAPDKFWAPGHPAVWQDVECRRSNKAGSAQAALAFAAAHPGTQFLHVACSGAKVGDGLFRPQSGTHKDAQLKQIADWMDANNKDGWIDALLVSIGGNDMGFLPTLIQCFYDNPPLPPPFPYLPQSGIPYPGISSEIPVPPVTPAIDGECNTHPGFLSYVNGNLNALDSAYDNLAHEIASKLRVANVFLTEYPDPTHKTAGSYCSNEPFGDPFMNYSRDEMAWADQIRTELNRKIGGAVQRHNLEGWKLIGGFSQAFADHGYCADDPWFNTVGASLLAQGPDVAGAMHPNEKGYRVYSDQILARLNALMLIPEVPANLRIQSMDSNSVQLVWGDASRNAQTFEVSYKRTTESDWTAAPVVAGNTRTWAQKGLMGGGSYQFRVRGCNLAGCSGASNVLAIALIPPAPPSNLHFSIIGRAPRIVQVLEWNDNSTNEDRFEIWSKDADQPWRPGPSVRANTNQVPVHLLGGTSFKLRACISNLCSESSNEVIMTTPAAPTNARLFTRTGRPPLVFLQWNDNSANEDRFEILVKRDATWAPAEFTLGPNITQTLIGDLLDGDAFKVRACFKQLCSDWSNETH